MAKLKIGCIADDFTGGSDAASFLKKGGLKVLLINGDAYDGFSPDDEIGAVVIALKTRSIPAPEAVEQSLAAAKWLLAQGAEQIYFKYCSTFDSTSAGNIGPVTDSLMELLGTPYTVLCPALPINGRTVSDGMLYVNGVLLGESPMRFHPLNPMHESKIELLMRQQSKYPCMSLGHAVYTSGADEIYARIAAALFPSEHGTVVLDYTETSQGSRLAELFGSLRLLTGGSGLLEFLARRVHDYGYVGAATSLPTPRGSRRLILAGSCSSMTQRQVETYINSGKAAVRIVPEDLLSGRQTLDRLKAAVRSANGDLLIYSTAPADSIFHSTDGTNIPKLLESTMGELALCGEKAGIDRIVVAGGETSGAVVRRLGHAVFIIENDAAPGVPVLAAVGTAGLRLVLKSGNFGDESFFLHALAD